MSLENPTIVQATSNTVTVVVNPSLNQIAVVEPQRGATVVRDSVIRGPEGPSGPSGPAANAAYAQANAAYAKANAPITVKEVHASNNAVVNTFTSINTLQFDSDSGMAVVDESSNTVTIKLNSTFKNWNINGNTGLVAFGLDTVNFISANGISLFANNNSSPKTFTIDAPALPNKLNIAGGTLTGTLNTQHILPTANVTYNIGSNDARFNDIWLSNSTIHLGEANITSVNDQVIISNLIVQNITTTSGNVDISGSLNVKNNVYVGGDITLDGNLIIGNVNTDTITIVADFTSDIVPDASDTYDLGKAGKRWDELHVNTANVETINLAGSLTAAQTATITVGATTVNTSFVSANVIISGPTETTYNTFSTNADVPITIDSFPSPSFTTVKYIIQSKSVDGYHSTELFCMQDGISSYITEYATLFNNYTLGSYSLTVSGGICNLIFHPNNPMNNIITVKLVRTALTA